MEKNSGAEHIREKLQHGVTRSYAYEKLESFEKYSIQAFLGPVLGGFLWEFDLNSNDDVPRAQNRLVKAFLQIV